MLQSIEITPDLTEQVHRRLLDAICTGALAPGTRLTQEELAASLNVSRQPVLQALRLLKRDGVVVDAGRRGVEVSRVEPELIAHVYEVRAALEALAAGLAARNGARIDPAAIARGRAAADTGDVKTMIDADMAFHRLIYRACGNPLVEESADRHWHHVRRAIGTALQDDAVRAEVWDQHAAIVDAINAGDAERAERLARDHCAHAGCRICARLVERNAAAAAAAPPQQARKGGRP